MKFNQYCLDIFCPKMPYDLTIMVDDCFVIKKAKINNTCSKFCINTKNKKLKIFARYNKQIVCKTIYLNNNSCENICVNFLFNTKLFQRTFNTIFLCDANYGFPVLRAMLNFGSKISN